MNCACCASEKRTNETLCWWLWRTTLEFHLRGQPVVMNFLQGECVCCLIRNQKWQLSLLPWPSVRVCVLLWLYNLCCFQTSPSKTRTFVTAWRGFYFFFVQHYSLQARTITVYISSRHARADRKNLFI